MNITPNLIKEGKGEDRILFLSSQSDNSGEKVKILEKKFRELDSSPLLKKGFEEFLLRYTQNRPKNIEYLFPILNSFNNPMSVKGTTHFTGQSQKLAEALCKLQVKNVGRGELYLVLSIEDMGMPSGTADFDLLWKNEKWEVKEIGGLNQRGFRAGKKGVVSQFPQIFEFYEAIKILDEVAEKMKDKNVQTELSKYSNNLFQELNKYLAPVSKRSSKTFKESILQGEIGKATIEYFNNLKESINNFLKEIQRNNQNKYTRVAFAGKAIKSRASKITPLDPEMVKKGIIQIDFLEDETKEVIEILTELPSFQINSDLQDSLKSMTDDIKKNLYNFIFMTKDTKNIFPIPEEQLEQDIELNTVSQGGLILQIGKESFSNITGIQPKRRKSR